MGKLKVMTIEDFMEENKDIAVMFFHGLSIEPNLGPCVRLSFAYTGGGPKARDGEAIVPLPQIYEKPMDGIKKELGREKYGPITDKDAMREIKIKLEGRLGGRTIYFLGPNV